MQTTGQLEAVKSMSVMSEVTGQVVKIIPNGSRVKKGDVIAVLDAPRMARQLRDQETSYRDAVSGLEKRKKDLAVGVQTAQFALDQAKQQLTQFEASQKAEMATKESQRQYDTEVLGLTRERFARTERQAERSLVAKQEVELAKADIKSKEFGITRQDKDLELAKAKQQSDLLDKQATVRRAEADLARAKASEQDEIQNVKMQLDIQKQQMDRARDQLSKATIKAPGDGIIALETPREYSGGGGSREISTGDAINEQMKVATLPDLSKLRVSLELSQEQARLVKRKLKARVLAECLPGRTFDAEVSEIASTAKEQNLRGIPLPTGDRVFPAYVELKNTKGADLRPGTSCVVTIVVDRIPKALTVPLECVFDRDQRKLVYVLRKGNFVPVEVELGPRNDDVVVVRKGLRPGDRVALHDMRAGPAGPSDGGGGKPAGLPLP